MKLPLDAVVGEAAYLFTRQNRFLVQQQLFEIKARIACAKAVETLKNERKVVSYLAVN